MEGRMTLQPPSKEVLADWLDEARADDIRARQPPPPPPPPPPPRPVTMANPSNRQHVVHQDYIVRQRYQNPLPPPPGSVKLLNIPTEGLSAYTSPGYAAGLARAQPINIEADAFLGMPLDLVGMPGIFDGDESSIQAPLVTPPVHPRDKNLLRPLKSLGVPKTEAAGVSFLRRTQYTAEDNRRNPDGSSRKLGTAAVKKRKPADVSRNEPINILRDVIKGFDIANPEDIYRGPDGEAGVRGAVPTPAELEAWKNPTHPSKSHLKPVAFYSILPDIDATTDDSGYMVAKFSGLPTDITDHHDPKMDAAFLHPLELPADQVAEFQAKAQAYEADPAHNPAPAPPAFDYEFFLPHDDITAENYKLKVNVENPNKDDPKLYTYNSHGGPENDSFRFEKVREYETGLQSANTAFPYQEVALVLHDPAGSSSRLPKGAYYYSVVSKVQLKPRRGTHLAQAGLAAGKTDDERQKIDVALVAIREPNDAEVAKRGGHKAEREEGAKEAGI
ncbi:hypothetical protein MMC30_000358 [Trapelia coarctata]|nr:hypothetical protein [Trapelia coarctata]